MIPTPAVLVRTLLPFILLLAAFSRTAGAQLAVHGARVDALAGASTALTGDPWSEDNPAGWAAVDRGSAAFYAAQLYGLEELRLAAARIVVPTSPGAVAFGIHTFGFSDYREEVLSVGFAAPLRLASRRSFHAGIRLRYHHVRIPGYETPSVLGLSLGVHIPLSPLVAIATHSENALALGPDASRRLAVGVALRPAPSLLVLADLEKDLVFPLDLRVGIESSIADRFFLRGGFTAFPARFSAGLGVSTELLKADVAAERHSVLGWSPSASLAVQW